MSEREHPHDGEAKSSRLSFWLIVTLVFPLFYTLSAGPAGALVKQLGFGRTVLHIVYLPLDFALRVLWLTEVGGSLKPLFEQYIRWWI
ncbi:MAG: hypothetical protein WD065_02285 [Planctomycetaceae bacterium]